MTAPKHLAVVTIMLLLCTSLCVEGQNVTESAGEIEDIRLVDNGVVGGSKGRVEIMYNGTWGTICSGYNWYLSEAKVACRMLGFEDAVCGISSSYSFGYPNYSTPIWMANVRCDGDESELELCSFNGWGIDSGYNYLYGYYCSRYQSAGVVCGDSNSTIELDVPYNITLTSSTTTSLNISWTVPMYPDEYSIRHRIRYSSGGGYSHSYVYSTALPGEQISHTLAYLEKDTNYSIRIAMDTGHSECGYSYDFGNFSDPVYFQTNATRKQSSIPVRLVTSQSGVNFMGRVEVQYNGTWGTICDDYFGLAAANVICGMLNFTEGALCYSGYGRFGRAPSSTKIWLDNVRCSTGDEVLEDCSFNDWGVHNCDHYDDVGVVCRPNEGSSYLPPVENVTATYVGPRIITIAWNPYQFPSGSNSKRLQVLYINSRGYQRTRYVYVYSSSQSNTYTLRYLDFGETYNISVRPSVSFSGCYSTLYGEYSNSLVVTTVETAPTGPPGGFHIIALNATSLEVRWELPAYDDRGGIIRGYKIFVQPASGGNEAIIDTRNNETEPYIVGELQQATSYRISVLAYTNGGDGPKTLTLTIATLNYNPLIIKFGYFGNGVDRHSISLYQYSAVHILCGTGNSSYVPDWYFANGTRVGAWSRNLQGGHQENGTAVLRIPRSSRIDYCFGGTYMCVVNTTTQYEKRNFTLVVGYSPPAPDKPVKVSAQSTSITIGWSESSCHGGHTLDNFQIRYYDSSDYQSYDYYYYGYYPYYYYNYRYISDVNASAKNYTINNLEPSTEYVFQIQAVSIYERSSSYSSQLTVSTLAPAPTPPRNVTAKLVGPLLVEVSWRIPALPNGNISHYTVVAVPFTSSKDNKTYKEIKIVNIRIINKQQKVFPGSATVGNIPLADHSITYRFRVSAAIMAGEVFNEGDFSYVIPSSILYVPNPTTPTVKPSVNPSVKPQTSGSGARAGEIGGITVGLLIVILLVVLIAVVIIKKRKIHVFKSFGSKKMTEVEHIYIDDSHPDEAESKDGSVFDVSDSKKLHSSL